MGFGNDGPRHWNNGMFGQLGYAVPWWGDNHSTISQPIHRFTDVIGKNLLGVMTMSDARVSRPPQRECLETIAKLCYRGRDVLNTRLIRFSDKRTFRPGHATPIPRAFLIHPVPFFLVKNDWLREYCELTLLMLSEAMQHSANDLETEITEEFAGRMGEFLQRILVLISVELLDVAKDDALDPAFTITDQQWQAYNPLKKITVFEALDTPSVTHHIPTEDDLKLLRQGIPTVSFNPAHIQQWPLGRPLPPANDGESNEASEANVSANANKVEFVPPPGV